MMQKNFDEWNEHKKLLHQKGMSKHYHEREVWWCALGVNIGYEEDGSGAVGERPVLVIKGLSKEVCLSVPLTTSQKKNPYHISLGNVGNKEAFAIISQIRLIDTRRLINRIAFIDPILFKRTKKAIKDLL